MQQDRYEKPAPPPPSKQMNALLKLAQKMDSNPKIGESILAVLAKQKK